MIKNDISIDDLVEHQEWLRRLASSVVGESEADDLVQDVFLKAVRQPPILRGPIQGWLTIVLRNTARMRFRSESRRLSRDSLVRDDAGETAPLPSERIERHQYERLLHTMVSDLPARYRATVVGLYGEGLSAVEFAQKHGLKSATVRQRHRQALLLLRQQLQGKPTSRLGQLRLWFMTLIPAAATEMSGPLALEFYEFGLIVL